MTYDASRARLITLALAIVLLPSPAHLVLVDDPHAFFVVALRLADVPLAVLVALCVPVVAARLRAPRPDPSVWLTAAFVGLVALAFLVHPSPQGAQTLFRLVAAVGVTVALLELRLDRQRRFILVALGITAVVQTALAIAQIVYGDLLVAYEHPPLFKAGPYIRPAGTLANGFVLAGLALVASSALAARALTSRRTLAWSAVVAVAAIPVGITFSRAAALGAALGAAALAPGALRGRTQALVLAAFALGIGLPALIVVDGWIVRDAQHSTAASASARVVLATQTLPLLSEDPLFGVGPGLTMDALRTLEREIPGSVISDQYMQPPHSLPLVIALEAGIPAGLLSVALLVLLAWRALRRGPAGWLAYATLLPYVALDNYLWTSPGGLTLLAIWVWVVLRGAPAPQEGSSASSISMTGIPSRTG